MIRSLFTTAVATALAASLGAQAPCFSLPLGTDLALIDDSTSAAQNLGFTFTYNGVAYTQVSVCSNGYIWLGTTGIAGGDFSPTEAELLAGAPRICPLWSDFNPGAVGSGKVWFDNSTPGVATVTWAGVFAFGTTTGINFQVSFDASNSVTVTYGAAAVPGTLNTTVLIGASPGAASVANPVSFATRPIISTSNTFSEAIPAVNGVPIPYGNFKMLWTPTNPGFVISDVTCTPNQLPPPASSAVVGVGCPALVSPALNAGDDTTHALTLPFAFPAPTGTFNNIVVSSNGFITLGTTNPGSGCCAGSPATLLTGPTRLAAFWQDLNLSATGNGEVNAYVDAITGEYVINWVSAGEFGATPQPANNFQIALSPTGTVTMRFLNVGIVSATRVALTGFSVGGGAADPGVTDISGVAGVNATTMYQTFANNASPIDMTGLEVVMFNTGLDYLVLTQPLGYYSNNIPATVTPLSIAAALNSRPQVGGTFTVNATGVQTLPNGVFAILLISTEVPGGFPLDGFGLTGCTAYVALPEIASFFNLTLGAATTSWPISIPNDNAFYGVSLMSQAVSDDLTANAFGYRVSNGLRWNFGL